VSGDPRETKNLRPIKGLASFDTAVDCASANNRLKRARHLQPERIQVCAGIGSQYQYQDHFLDAKRTAIRVRKMLCHRAGIATGNWESYERDIRDKI
jgi:hypothetical protein